MVMVIGFALIKYLDGMLNLNTANQANETATNVGYGINNGATNFAPKWNYSTYYYVGDLVVYNGSGYTWYLYRRINLSGSGQYPTNSNYWQKVDVKTLLANAGGGNVDDVQINGTSIVSSKIANIQTNTAYNSSSNKIATMTDLLNVAKNLAPVWATSTNYIVGDVVLYTVDNYLYECISAHTSSSSIKPTSTSYWKKTTIVASTIGLLTEEM